VNGAIRKRLAVLCHMAFDRHFLAFLQGVFVPSLPGERVGAEAFESPNLLASVVFLDGDPKVRVGIYPFELPLSCLHGLCIVSCPFLEHNAYGTPGLRCF
jgi:hypothetical protein